MARPAEGAEAADGRIAVEIRGKEQMKPVRGMWIAGASVILLAGIVTGMRAQSLPLEPFHDSGQGITAAYEGWFHNGDGTYSILFGYYNRNQHQELDIPIGPDNHLDPGGPDRGQPTHFLPGRQWGVFTVTVPKNFGDQKVTWSLNTNGQRTSIPASLNPLWEVEPFKDATGNTPPLLRFDAGASVQGPRPVTVRMTAEAGKPLPISVTASDDAKLVPGMQAPKSPPVTLLWSKFRGPGEVEFSATRPMIEKIDSKSGAVFEGKAMTTATFRDAGEYTLYLLANDWTGKGGRGFQCCWTNALVDVTVKAASAEH